MRESRTELRQVVGEAGRSAELTDEGSHKRVTVGSTTMPKAQSSMNQAFWETFRLVLYMLFFKHSIEERLL